MIKVSSIEAKVQKDTAGTGDVSSGMSRIDDLNKKVRNLNLRPISPTPKFHIRSNGNLSTLKILQETNSANDDKKTHIADQPPLYSIKSLMGIFATLSIFWIGGCLAYFLFSNQGLTLSESVISNIGSYLSIFLTPVALLWVVFSHYQRRKDIETYSALLKEELNTILFPPDAQSDKITSDIAMLSGQAREFKVSSQAAMRTINEARLGLQKDIKALNAVMDAVDQKADAITKNLLDKSANLSSLSDNISQRFEDITRSSHGLLERTKAISRRLEAASKEVAAKNDHSLSRMDDVESRLSAQTEQLSSVTNEFGADLSRIGDGLSVQLNYVEDISERVLNNLEEGAQKISEQGALFDQIGSKLQGIFVESDHRTNNLEVLIESRISSLEQFGVKILDRAEETASNLKRQVQDVSSLSGQVSAETQQLQQNFVKQHKDMMTQISSTMECLNSMSHDMQKNIQEISGEAIRSHNLISNISNDIKVNCKEMEGVSSGSISTLRSFGHQINDELSRLDKISDDLVSKTQNSASGVRAVINDVMSIGDESDAILVKLERVNDSFHESAKLIKDVTGQSEKQIQQAQKSFEHHGYELTEIVGNVLSSIKGASSDLDEVARQAADTSEEVVAKISESMTHTELQTEALQKAAESRLEQAGAFVERITYSSKELLQRTTSELKDMRAIEKSFMGGHTYLKEQMDNILKVSGAYTDELKKQSTLLAQNAGDSTHRILESSKLLTQNMSAIGKTSANLTLKINEVREKIENESKDIFKISAGIIDRYELVSTNVVKQKGEIEDLSKTMQKTSYDLKEMMTTQEQDGFISSSRYLLESIYSLTVDLTRAIDNGISERMWRAFNEGDITVFMRHLQNIEKNIPYAALANKYKKDHELRTYAQRYIKQFEKVYQDIQLKQQNGIMIEVIRFSDIAKLYRILCRISGLKDVTNIV